MKYRAIKFITLIIIIFCYSCDSETQNNSINEDDFSKPLVEVVNPIKKEYSYELVITGTLEANQEVELLAMESGMLKAIHKDIGDYVMQGQVIAELENPKLYQEYKQAEADFKAKKSHYYRLKELYDKTPDLVSAEDFETTTARYEGAKATFEALQMRYGYLKIKAPFSGYITHRYVHKGAMIQSGLDEDNPQKIVTLKDMNTIRLVVHYPESDVDVIKLGADVNITLPELPGKAYQGKIARMANALNPETKTMRVEID